MPLTLFIAASKPTCWIDSTGRRPPIHRPALMAMASSSVHAVSSRICDWRASAASRRALVRVGHVDDVGDVELVELLQDRLRRNRKRDGFRLDHAADVTHLRRCPPPDVVRR